MKMEQEIVPEEPSNDAEQETNMQEGVAPRVTCNNLIVLFRITNQSCLETQSLYSA